MQLGYNYMIINTVLFSLEAKLNYKGFTSLDYCFISLIYSLLVISKQP